MLGRIGKNGKMLMRRSCLSSKVERFEKLEINGHPYYYAVKKYITNDSELFWRFIMMFDYETGKVCVISSYDGGYEEYMEELLNSVRFNQ